jgi:hypothetical protein
VRHKKQEFKAQLRDDGVLKTEGKLTFSGGEGYLFQATGDFKVHKSYQILRSEE